MKKTYFCLLLVISARAKPQIKATRQHAVWADEIENESEKVISPEPAIWADEKGEVDLNGPIEHKLKIDVQHNFTPVIGKRPIDRNFDSGKYILDKHYYFF